MTERFVVDLQEQRPGRCAVHETGEPEQTVNA
jgi:hypothetical protein